MIEITKPGIYDGITNAAYHSDPMPGGSLSSTGARKLLPPSCPALFRQFILDGEEAKKEFDFGSAAHLRVLGVGPPVVIVDAPDWKTKAAQLTRKEAREAGAVPILAKDWEHVEGMAAALRRHPLAGALFDPQRGRPEQSLFWTDPATGVWCRARLDFLPNFTVVDGDGAPTAGRGYPGRLIIPEYKTCHSAEPEAVSRAMYEHRYYMQADWYLRAVKALSPAYQHPGAADPAFVFVFQERHPPYLIEVVEPKADALAWGRVRNAKALEVYRRCRELGVWPGYSAFRRMLAGGQPREEVVEVGLPSWAEYQLEAARERGDYDLEEMR